MQAIVSAGQKFFGKQVSGIFCVFGAISQLALMCLMCYENSFLQAMNDYQMTGSILVIFLCIQMAMFTLSLLGQVYMVYALLLDKASHDDVNYSIGFMGVAIGVAATILAGVNEMLPTSIATAASIMSIVLIAFPIANLYEKESF